MRVEATPLQAEMYTSGRRKSRIQLALMHLRTYCMRKWIHLFEFKLPLVCFRSYWNGKEFRMHLNFKKVLIRAFAHFKKGNKCTIQIQKYAKHIFAFFFKLRFFSLVQTLIRIRETKAFDSLFDAFVVYDVDRLPRWRGGGLWGDAAGVQTELGPDGPKNENMGNAVHFLSVKKGLLPHSENSKGLLAHLHLNLNKPPPDKLFFSSWRKSTRRFYA